MGLFSHVVETERRFYLCNSVDVKVRSDGGEVYFDVTMADAWVWDIYRPARFVKNVRVVTFKDVNVEELRQVRPRAAQGAATSSRRPVVSSGRCRAVARPQPRAAGVTPSTAALLAADRTAVRPARSVHGRSGSSGGHPGAGATTASGSRRAYLADQGMAVLDRNWRCARGEIDLVALDGDCLVVCEVKTRRTDAVRRSRSRR